MSEFSDSASDSDPIAWFQASIARAAELESFDVSRAALATVSATAIPNVRFVLVKQIDARGFAFFTNYESTKARELSDHPHTALAFHWAKLGVQVRVQGLVERVTDAESDAYFASRPRGSQLGAWASAQSRPIQGRAALVAQFDEVVQRFANQQQIPRPPFWGGYRVVPDSIEFWRNGDDRLHDRFRFVRTTAGWSCQRLQP